MWLVWEVDLRCFSRADIPEVKAERPTPAIKRGALHANASWESMTVAWGQDNLVWFSLQGMYVRGIAKYISVAVFNG